MIKRQSTEQADGRSGSFGVDLSGVKQPSAVDRALLTVSPSTMEWTLFILGSVFFIFVGAFIFASVFQEKLGIPSAVFQDKGTVIAWLWIVILPGFMLICFSLAMSRHQEVTDQIERGEMQDVQGVVPEVERESKVDNRDAEAYNESVDSDAKFTSPGVAV